MERDKVISLIQLFQVSYTSKKHVTYPNQLELLVKLLLVAFGLKRICVIEEKRYAFFQEYEYMLEKFLLLCYHESNYLLFPRPIRQLLIDRGSVFVLEQNMVAVKEQSSTIPLYTLITYPFYNQGPYLCRILTETKGIVIQNKCTEETKEYWFEWAHSIITYIHLLTHSLIMLHIDCTVIEK